VAWLGRTRRLRLIVCVVAALAAASACFLVFFRTNSKAPDTRSASNAAAQQVSPAVRAEKIYNGFAVGTDVPGNEGYNAAQAAEAQLRLDFLASFQNPQKNSASQTVWDVEQAELINDSLKYGSDRTLDAAAMYWGETHLYLPVASADELMAQLQTMKNLDQPGEREYAATMASYLAQRFDTLNKMAPKYQTATDGMDGRGVPLDLADLQVRLQGDEVNRTFGKRPK
jgi:hypothetical protein